MFNFHGGCERSEQPNVSLGCLTETCFQILSSYLIAWNWHVASPSSSTKWSLLLDRLNLIH